MISRNFLISFLGIVPEAVFDILPDDELWKFPCAQVIFDADPAPYGVDSKNQLEMMSQAMIRGVMDESGEQFVAYFLPTAETMDKRNRYSLLDRYSELILAKNVYCVCEN